MNEIEKLNAIIDSYQPRLQRYKDILQEIKEYINAQGIDNKWNMRIQRFRSEILQKITKAEEQ